MHSASCIVVEAEWNRFVYQRLVAELKTPSPVWVPVCQAVCTCSKAASTLYREILFGQYFYSICNLYISTLPLTPPGEAWLACPPHRADITREASQWLSKRWTTLMVAEAAEVTSRWLWGSGEESCGWGNSGTRTQAGTSPMPGPGCLLHDLRHPLNPGYNSEDVSRRIAK